MEQLARVIGAEQIVLRALAIEVIADIAATKADPESWVRDFIGRLHLRIDKREQREPNAGPPEISEPARAAIDSIGNAAIHAIRARSRDR